MTEKKKATKPQKDSHKDKTKQNKVKKANRVNVNKLSTLTSKLSAISTKLKNNLKIITIVVLLGAVIGLGYKYKGELIVATVDGKPITRFELWRNLEKQAGKQSLETLITQRLIQKEALKHDLVITQEDIDTEVQKIEKTVSAQGSTLEQALAEQGMTPEILKEQIKLQKIIEKLVIEKVVVTEDEINEAIKSFSKDGQEEDPTLRQQLSAQLEKTKQNQAVQKFLADIRENATINILHGSF